MRVGLKSDEMVQNQSTMEKGHGKKTGTSKWGGLSLILVGGAIFLWGVLNVSFENWWALFILMPALAIFGIGWAIPRHGNDHFDQLSLLTFLLRIRIFLSTGSGSVGCRRYVLTQHGLVGVVAFDDCDAGAFSVGCGRQKRGKSCCQCLDWFLSLGKRHHAGFGRRFSGTHFGVHRPGWIWSVAMVGRVHRFPRDRSLAQWRSSFWAGWFDEW